MLASNEIINVCMNTDLKSNLQYIALFHECDSGFMAEA